MARFVIQLAVFAIVAGAGLPSDATTDPVAALNQRLQDGEATLEFDEKWGYLPALLDALEIPRSSQLLVFSKTSAQFRSINPRNPRAIYFNDEVYVGWVPGAPILELSVATSGGGAAFYTIHQVPDSRPRLTRDSGSCLQCHESHRTLGVPGHLTRSVFPGFDGLPHFRHGTVNVTPATPISQRWGGWFVTGRIDASHRGNAVGPDHGYDEFAAGKLARNPRSFFDPAKYLVPSSDVVAHLVLAHQTRVHNAFAKAGHEARAAIRYRREMERLFGEPSEELLASVQRRIEGPAERLVMELLGVGTARFPNRISGDSGFAQEFQERGQRDSQGRSLRDLDLRTRLFRHACSFLIRSPAYAGLPAKTREYVESRLAEIVAGRDATPEFAHLDAEDQRVIRAVLDWLR